MAVFAFVVAATVSLILCRSTCTEIKNQDMNLLNDYTSGVKKIIEETVRQSDYILNYNYLCGNIVKTDISTEEKYTFSYDIAQYFKSIESDQSKYCVYFSNPDLFEGIYLYKMKRLEKSEEIEENLKISDPYWSKDMGRDTYGNDVLSFYREISEGNILECKVVMPQPSNPDIHILKDVPDGAASVSINENYSAVIIGQNPVKTYAKIVFLVYFVMLIFYTLMMFVLYVQNKNISASVTGFIAMLEKIDIENIDKNTELAAEINERKTKNKEIAVMKRVICELLQKGQQEVKQRYETEKQIRETEFRLLQRQIDPHTLYNSLSAIKYNAFLRNDMKTTELVDNMVLYYRAVLNRGKEFFTIADEMQMLKYYVRISEFSHGKNYNFTEDTDECAKNIEVMHLMLQPFAENAIMHGLIGHERKAEFKISCKMIDGYIVFRVFDNGYGIPSEKLEKLKDLEHYDESYGIKNVYRRMKFLYGDDSDIAIDSKENEYTEVVIRFKPNKIMHNA